MIFIREEELQMQINKLENMVNSLLKHAEELRGQKEEKEYQLEKSQAEVQKLHQLMEESSVYPKNILWLFPHLLNFLVQELEVEVTVFQLGGTQGASPT